MILNIIFSNDWYKEGFDFGGLLDQFIYLFLKLFIHIFIPQIFCFKNNILKVNFGSVEYNLEFLVKKKWSKMPKIIDFLAFLYIKYKSKVIKFLKSLE